MTSIWSNKNKQSAVNKIKNSEAFFAIITKNFVNDEKCLEECRIAEKMNKPMYAIIKDWKAWKKIEHKFMWRKNVPFIADFDKYIEKDLEIIRSINDI